MLTWLKRRVKVSFNNRYTNILRRPEMFLTEQSMLNQQAPQNESIKLLLFNDDGIEYSLDVPLEMTLERVKAMAIGHFYSPLEAIDLASQDSGQSTSYRLVLARDYRTLPEERSVTAEELVDNDEILLLRNRAPAPKSTRENFIDPSDESASLDDVIERETANLEQRNWNRQAEPVNSTLDFKLALRQILVTMIEASVHLMAPEENAPDLFVLILEHLEKRHKPRVDKTALRHLTDMGFSEAKAIKALQLKSRNVVEAMEWLLEETSKQQSGGDGEVENDVLLLSRERRRAFFMSGKDPAFKVMQEFRKYVEKWFVADASALQSLVRYGYGEDLAKEALRISCNNERLAREFLEGESDLSGTFQKGFPRESPVMSAILDSPIVQVALSRPKTLFALMVLCETPNNVNVWLSDPETHPVVSQVLRIYHAEKHRLNNPPTESSSSSLQQEDDDPMEDESVTLQEENMANFLEADQVSVPSMGPPTSPSGLLRGGQSSSSPPPSASDFALKNVTYLEDMDEDDLQGGAA